MESVCHQIFQLICKKLYKPMIDVFATAQNAKLPLYISPIPDPAAYAVDSLSFSWNGFVVVCFPSHKDFVGSSV